MQKKTFINKNTRKVKYVENNTIFLESSKGILAPFPVLENGCQYYLLVAGYSSTVIKIMGQDLDHVTLAFDFRTLSPDIDMSLCQRYPLLTKLYLCYGWEKVIFLTLPNVMVFIYKKKHLFFKLIFFMIFYSINVECWKIV